MSLISDERVEELLRNEKEKDAEIELLKKELAHEQDMAAQADVACIRLKALLSRAADALEAFSVTPYDLIDELRKAAQ